MALSANAGLDTRNDKKTYHSAVVATSSVIYRHALVAINSSGLAVPASNSPTLTAGGLAVDDGVASFPITGDGTLRVTMATDIEVLVPAVTAVTAAMVRNTAIYAVDDAQVTNATTLGPLFGRIELPYTANEVWLHIRGDLFAKAS